MRTLIVGHGVVGKHMQKLFPQSVLHDPPQGYPAELKPYDLAFICVPTDMNKDGSADTSIVTWEVERWSQWCGAICIKSTVPPGTTEALIHKGHIVAMSPEYTGATQHSQGVDAEFVIVGGHPRARSLVAEAYKETQPATIRILFTDATTAELVKYGENAFLAMKVAFVNEMARICEQFDVDPDEWRELWLQDPRINRSHTFAYRKHPYYRSHCLDKDIPALIAACEAAGYDPMLLKEMHTINEHWKINHKGETE